MSNHAPQTVDECGNPLYGDQKTREAAERLYELARMHCGTSAAAARIIIACHRGDTVITALDFRRLDRKNLHAAWTLWRFAVVHGCERVLPQKKIRWLYENFRFPKLER